MTPSQLLLARLSRTPNARRPSAKKLTKDQLISLTSASTCCDVLMIPFVFQARFGEDNAHDDPTRASLDAGGDTDPATDPEESYATVGVKHKAGRSAGSATGCVSAYFHYPRSNLYL